MDFEKFLRTGELSDITVIVDKKEFKLHTFPLFTKSEFFKKAVASSKSSAPYVVRLDNQFPGGAKIFELLTNYFYTIPITIDHKNIVPLRSAACFVECESLATSIDKRFDEILLVARAKYDLGIPLVLLEQCVGEYQHWAKEAKIVDRCLESLAESLVRGAGLQTSKTDREILVRLPLEWMIALIQRIPTTSRLAVLPFAKHYISVHVLDSSTTTTTTTENETEHQSAFVPVNKNENLSPKSNNEKRQILDQIAKELGNTLEQLPLSWLNAVHEKSVELKCECEPALSSFVIQAILNSSDLDDNMQSIPDDVMARLLERVSKHKEEHVKDPHLLSKLSSLVDSYVAQLRQRGTLTSEQFVQLATCIPKEQRDSHDSLLLALDGILKDEKSQLSDDEREELLNQIDFSRVSEETIAACKSNKLIPQQLITDAALSLCAKLRSELEETQTRLCLAETELAKTRPSYSSSSYRSRLHDTSLRLPSRSRSTYSNSYDLPISSSVYNYSKYDTDNDNDYLLPSRYLTSTLSGRYGTYSSYYY